MPEAILTTKGQLTLPKEIREALALSPGDHLYFFFEGPGKVRMETHTLSVKTMKGIIRSPRRKPVSLEEMKTIIRKRGAKQ